MKIDQATYDEFKASVVKYLRKIDYLRPVPIGIVLDLQSSLWEILWKSRFDSSRLYDAGMNDANIEALIKKTLKEIRKDLENNVDSYKE
jgi:hypothetical protein